MFEEESAPEAFKTGTDNAWDIFAEMRPFMVDALDVDDSRAAIYARMDGE